MIKLVRYFQKKSLSLFHKRILPFFIYYFIRSILLTCRIKTKGLENYLKIASERGCILASWHNRILLFPYFAKCQTPQIFYSVFISKSRDGNIAANVVDSFPNGQSLRVAHDSRAQALKSMIKELKTGKVIIITPDGPKGPIYEIKPGIVFAAALSASKIYPFTWKADRYWQFKTWDKMMMPKPFSNITLSIGKSLEIPQKTHSNWKDETLSLQKCFKDLETESI